MHTVHRILAYCVIQCLLLLCCAMQTAAQTPLVYTAEKVSRPPIIDGYADPVWDKVPWSSLFVDIEGSKKPAPAYATQMKMLWNDTCLFIFAWMEEPHLWATLTTHDAIIYRDHDFEVFIDPRKDGLNYYEIEINALGTLLDLFMDKPYKDKGIADLSWNATGIRSAIALHGTLNNNTDTDTGWSVEMAIPYAALSWRGNTHQPSPGDSWRINFSRVEWLMQPDGISYSKQKKADGTNLPEQNWVWSPQGIIDMHHPQFWGTLIFNHAR